MFTGIVSDLGTVSAVGTDGAGRRLTVEADLLTDAPIGASVSVSGVCLTVIDHPRAAATMFDLSEETLARTTLGALAVGDRVNLERPVRPVDELGGHVVQGHVDGVATVTGVTPEGEGVRVVLRLPDGLSRYVVEKGSITVDGISLTASWVDADDLAVALVPHTLQVTTAGAWRNGTRVNIEVDILAKYVERLTRTVHAAQPR